MPSALRSRLLGPRPKARADSDYSSRPEGRGWPTAGGFMEQRNRRFGPMFWYHQMNPSSTAAPSTSLDRNIRWVLLVGPRKWPFRGFQENYPLKSVEYRHVPMVIVKVALKIFRLSYLNPLK
jgi:hypothetical protein